MCREANRKSEKLSPGKIGGQHMYQLLHLSIHYHTLLFNSFMPSGFFYFNSLDRSIFCIRVSDKFLLLSCFVEICELNANSVDHDQMLCSAVSDQGLHCLPMSHLWDPRHIWVNDAIENIQTHLQCY